MGYTNSSLATYKRESPNNSGTRTHSIDRITPHCLVGQWPGKQIGDYFATCKEESSCNYGIGADGVIALCVPESKRSWCSSSPPNDHRAVTIECASDTKSPYAFTDTVYQRLIELCVDICKRNGKTKLIWFGDKNKSLNYEPAPNECVLTVHRWFANKACPGDWLYSRMGDLANKVNEKLNNKEVKKVKTLTDMIREEVPEYAQDTIKYLVNKGAIKGTGESLGLTDDMIRILVILDRLGKLR